MSKPSSSLLSDDQTIHYSEYCNNDIKKIQIFCFACSVYFIDDESFKNTLVKNFK